MQADRHIEKNTITKTSLFRQPHAGDVFLESTWLAERRKGFQGQGSAAYGNCYSNLADFARECQFHVPRSHHAFCQGWLLRRKMWHSPANCKKTCHVPCCSKSFRSGTPNLPNPKDVSRNRWPLETLGNYADCEFTDRTLKFYMDYLENFQVCKGSIHRTLAFGSKLSLHTRNTMQTACKFVMLVDPQPAPAQRGLGLLKLFLCACKVVHPVNAALNQVHAGSVKPFECGLGGAGGLANRQARN